MQETPLVIRETQTAKLLNVSVAALRKWRREGRGPSFVRLERCIGYRVSDIEAFLAQNLQPNRPNTTEPIQSGFAARMI